MTPAGPELVTVHLWRVPTRRVGAAVGRVAVDRFALRRQPGAAFARLLGTAGSVAPATPVDLAGCLPGATPGPPARPTFRLRDAEPRRWGLLVAWRHAADAAAFERTAVPRGWARLAEETWRAELRPLAARGRWSGRAPFGSPTRGNLSGRPGHDHPGAGRVAGPVAALTRARLVWRRAAAFWRAVPAVTADLAGRPGVLLALGVGERPVGLQGTFSVWDSAAALREFAYTGAAHAEAIRQTARRRWYAEELFARFAVLDAAGTVDGRDPLRSAAW